MTRLNIFNATVIVPLLARIILCAAFLTMGWNKLMYTHTFTGEDAATLIELGVIHDAPAATPAAPVVSPASFQEDQSADDSLPLPEPPAYLVQTDPLTGEQSVQAKRLHTVTLAVHKAGFSYPIVLAWIATFTELIGGALLLVGLFSRVWGLGLAIAMGVAFYLTSYATLLKLGLFALAADIESGYAGFHSMYTQLALGVLALGIFLTGPGPVSLDRLLFRSNHHKDSDLVEDEL